MKKITTESDDVPAEGEDHGVLADAGLDTTAIGILGTHTAQVRVVLPHLTEESDDEVVDDEFEPGDVRAGEIVIELPAEQVEEAAEAFAEARETGEEPALTGEIVEDVVDAVRDRLGERDEPVAEGEVIDVVVVPVTSHEDDRAQDDEGQDQDDEGALLDDAHVEDAHDGSADPEHAPEFVEESPVEDDPDETALEQHVADEYVEDEHAPGAPAQPPVDGWRLAAAELAAEHAAPQPETEPETGADAEVEPEADASPVTAPSAVDKAKSYARIWAEETAAHRAASAELATPTDPQGDATRTDAPQPQTTGALTMTARRLEDLGKNAERESSDLLTADRVLNPHRVARPAPEGAWSEFVYGLTGGRLNLGDSRKVRARKALDARVAAPLAGETRFVPILSRKGGVGKTTVTTLLGMALANGRDDRVIAIDANPDRGTLADRIGKRTEKTVRDLVHRSGEIRGFNDISRFVARDETRLDVLASDPDPRIAEAFGEDDYRTVADVAEHFYSLVLTDTGTGIIHSVMSATLSHADQLIIVTGLNLDEVRLASETITWLESNGYEQLARHAIVVLNQQSEGTPMVRLNELEVHFGSRVRAVVHLPYDRALATGAAIVYRDLQPQTRDAARDLAARVVDGLREGRAA
ncbi:MinD/ParA family ATP-binding protein [Microbacterium rhizophilus]|uniref:MinD/ParA family ATP-binding protein n=1 Tax=Microbacterium rhizophilus TaxID=3138934 RepID=UPI0031E563F3